MLFAELPVLDRPAAARAAGFSTVETWWLADAADAWADAVSRAGISVALLNADGGDLAAGDRGFLNVAALRERELARIDEALHLAVRVGARNVNVLAGRLLPDVPEARQRAEVVSLLREAAERAEAAGVAILLEPINTLDVPGYVLPTAADVREVIEDVDSPSVRLLYDAYHAARSGADPVSEAPDYVDVIAHVQYADCPGRGAPGTGEVDLERLLQALRQAGYEGLVGLEFDPRGETAASVARLPR
jgi:hydroxypyruvate isomerase